MIEVDVAGVVDPAGGDHRAEDAVVGIRQRAELVLDEVAEGGLRRLEEAQAVELSSDAGSLCGLG